MAISFINRKLNYFAHDDGGRAAAGFKPSGDCVARAIAIATEQPYTEIRSLIDSYGASERNSKRRRTKSSGGKGVYKPTTRRILADLGWEWVPTMGIGTGCRVHLRADELPKGRIIANLSKHVVAVIDGVIHDTYDPSRGGTRCVYGYWRKHD